MTAPPGNGDRAHRQAREPETEMMVSIFPPRGSGAAGRPHSSRSERREGRLVGPPQQSTGLLAHNEER